MSINRGFSFAFTSRKRLAGRLLFVLGAVVSSPSPIRAQAPGSRSPGLVLGPGQAGHGVGRLVNPRLLPKSNGKRTPLEMERDVPPGYFEAKELAKTETLPLKTPFAQPHVISKNLRLPLKQRSSRVSPLSGHPGERPDQAYPSSATQPPPILGNGFLLDQEQFVGNQFCDVGSSCFAPPDTQLAAGFNEIVETTNNTMRVFSKGGTVLQTNDLTPFFGAAPDQTSTDNKVVFDSGAGRYYMANLQVNNLANPTGSQIKMGVSQG